MGKSPHKVRDRPEQTKFPAKRPMYGQESAAGIGPTVGTFSLLVACIFAVQLSLIASVFGLPAQMLAVFVSVVFSSTRTIL